jgi:hypothetical protein
MSVTDETFSFDKCIILVDLADQQSFDGLLNSGTGGEFVRLTLSHGLDIPVGIGFSLPILPDLLLKTDDILSQLNHCAIKYAQRSEFIEDLKKVGISVDPNLLTATT